MLQTENCAGNHPERGAAKYFPASRARVLERSSVPNPDPRPISVPVEPSRVQLIRQRLRSDFYEVPPASERIAASVLADLNEAKKGPSALPQ
jgi:hypothetical protein